MKELFVNNAGKTLIEDQGFSIADTSSIPAIITGYTFLKDKWGSLNLINFVDGDSINFSLSEEVKKVCAGELNFFRSRLKSDDIVYTKVFVTENGFDSDTESIITGMSSRSMFKRFQFVPVILDLSRGRVLLDGKYKKSNLKLVETLKSLLERKDSLSELYDLSFIMSQESQKSRLSNLAKDETQKPYITYILIALNVIMFLVMTAAGGTKNTDVLIKFGAKVNTLIVEGQYWRLISSAFIHIGLAHIAFNMYGLYSIGYLIEMIYGHVSYLFIYMISAIFGSISSFIFSTSLSAGASGAIFGLFGSLLYLGQKRPKMFSTSFGLNVLVVIGFNLVYGFSNSGIDNFAHLGGLIGGYIAANALGLINEKKEIRKKTILIAVIFALAISGLFIGIKKNLSSYEYNYETGITYFNSKKYSVSEGYFQKAVSLKPNSGEARAMLSLAYYNDGKESQGKQEYDRAVSIDKNQPVLYFNLGNYFYGHRRYAESEDMFRKFISVDPGAYEGYLNLGTVLHMQEKYPEAETNLKKAVEMKPDNFLANANLGYLYFDEIKYTEAKKYLTKAAQLDPKNSEIQQTLSFIKSQGY